MALILTINGVGYELAKDEELASVEQTLERELAPHGEFAIVGGGSRFALATGADLFVRWGNVVTAAVVEAPTRGVSQLHVVEADREPLS